jgi:hypothetical protein
MHIVSLLLLVLISSCSGRNQHVQSLKETTAFKELESVFSGQFSVSGGSVTLVEFCPNYTCYAFEAPTTTSPQSLVDFIYLYLSFSSEYASVDIWRNAQATRVKAKQLLKSLGNAACSGDLSEKNITICVLDSLMIGKHISLYDVRYDENERIATLVNTVGLKKYADISQSCRDFVKEFYTWYVPIALKDGQEPASLLAIRQRPSLFGESLLKALNADFRAQEKAKGEIVGIDYDPFLAGQDPAQSYHVVKVIVQDEKCFADVKSANSKSYSYDVRSELKQSGGRWRFVNFHYNTDIVDFDNLMSILLGLRQKRGG